MLTGEVLLVSGSLRRGSYNTALLREAASALPSGVGHLWLDGIAAPPPYSEDGDADRDARVQRLDARRPQECGPLGIAPVPRQRLARHAGRGDRRQHGDLRRRLGPGAAAQVARRSDRRTFLAGGRRAARWRDPRAVWRARRVCRTDRERRPRAGPAACPGVARATRSRPRARVRTRPRRPRAPARSPCSAAGRRSPRGEPRRRSSFGRACNRSTRLAGIGHDGQPSVAPWNAYATTCCTPTGTSSPTSSRWPIHRAHPDAAKPPSRPRTASLATLLVRRGCERVRDGARHACCGRAAGVRRRDDLIALPSTWVIARTAGRAG